MGMMTDTGASRTYNHNNMMYVEEVAILLDNAINKYIPGMHTFKLQSIAGLQPNTNIVTTEKHKISLLNKNPDGSSIDYTTLPIHRSSCLRLYVPVSVTRTYVCGTDHPKFIPRNTRFIVGFPGGDFTKDPVILRGEWEDVNDLSRVK